jgi:hypothetical protein
LCKSSGISKKTHNKPIYPSQVAAAAASAAEDMGAIEAMIKRSVASQQHSPQLPPQFPPLSLSSAAEMMSFLNAKSLEQQAKAAAAAAALQQAAAVSAALTANEQVGSIRLTTFI